MLRNSSEKSFLLILKKGVNFDNLRFFCVTNKGKKKDRYNAGL
ncbi:hypothetical protein HMPREF3191_01487 [Veillonellaceae bacterium DNF00626]|nr:hypothetical protein HMPREF3191_01487 [Veillonellaceae bacterium DNF00626]